VIKILELPLDEDLAPLYQYLRSHNVPIRIIEASGRQEVWVADEQLRDLTLELYQRYRQDPQVRAGLNQWQAEGGDSRQQRHAPGERLLGMAQTPVVWAGLAGMLLIIGLVYLGWPGISILSKLFFTDPTLSDYATLDTRLAMLELTLARGEWWRLLTPIFLHAGAMHLIFNALWYWYLGVRVERVMGTKTMLGLVLLTGVGANLAQYLVSGPGFGGMSGVVYGLFGYVGWRMFFAPRPGLTMPPAILVFALVWLLIGFTGISMLLVQGQMANTAHLVGLLLGILMAALGSRFGRQV